MDPNAIVSTATSSAECICSLGYFDNDATDAVTCAQCDTNCESCDGASSNDCLTCVVGFYMQPPIDTS